MDINIPDMEQVRAALADLSLKQLEALADKSGVPKSTLYKIKKGETEDPGIETVRKFAPHIEWDRLTASGASAEDTTEAP